MNSSDRGKTSTFTGGSRSAGGERVEPPFQSRESVDVSSVLAPVLVLEVLALAASNPGSGRVEMSEDSPGQPSCRVESFRWVINGVFCMDNIKGGLSGVLRARACQTGI